MTIDELNSINAREIAYAGPRYSPSIDPAAPNLQLADLIGLIDVAGLTHRYVTSLEQLAASLREAWARAPESISEIFSSSRHSPSTCVALLTRLAAQKGRPSVRTRDALARAAKAAFETLRAHERHLYDVKAENSKQRGSGAESIDTELYETRRLERPLGELVGLVRSPKFSLIRSNRLLILGEWGTGKTHLLCDVTRSRITAGLPTLFIQAHRLPSGVNPLSGLCTTTGLAGSPTSLLKELNALGRAASCRTLLIIDGINEGDRNNWRRHLPSITETMTRYPFVAIIVSCRSPFQNLLMSRNTINEFVQVTHNGFQDVEFEAQREFFTYYQIPIPHVPLLAPEFSRPLFLKILCQTLAGRTVSAKTRQMNLLASGQKSMTKLFEDFVIHLGAKIERDFGLGGRSCWRLLKGARISTGDIVGIAPKMAATVCDYVETGECKNIIRQVTGLGVRRADGLMRRLIVDGLLTEDLVYRDGKQIDVVRLPYQRFSDHLICRHLLDENLATDSEQSIRRSFYRNRPLGRIFEIDRWGHSYKMPGLATAITLEFPERIKRTLRDSDERELVFFLPKRRRLVAPLIDVFLEGLTWRDVGSFSAQTDHIVSTLLELENQHVQQETLEALVTLASRPNHPYSAERLHKHLDGMTMSGRDLFWSEFVRTASDSSAVHRILLWVEGLKENAIPADVARSLITLSALFLTTTNRALRDKATKVLVTLGERHPQILFDTSIRNLGFNDPYVPERLLAACYGVIMRHWAFPQRSLTAAVPSFARTLYDLLFKPGGPNATKHILLRDYAAGICELVHKMDGSTFVNRPLKNFRKPYTQIPFLIPDGESITEEDCKAADSAIHMDFENYTVGRLVKDRSNYDSKHPGYREVLRQIKWRVLNLGYSEAKFERIDRVIAERNFHLGRTDDGRKIDRYGKKYSWIAYFEVAGQREDDRALPDWYEARFSDCDIDPSFPGAAVRWQPTLNPFFVEPFVSARDWLTSSTSPSYNHLLHRTEVAGRSGSWTLLDGFIQENAPDDPRHVFSFLRGFLIQTDAVEELKRKFSATEYPGNHALPSAHSDHYTFAGEIPWSTNYMHSLRYANGRPKRHIAEAFKSQEQIGTRRRRNSARTMSVIRVIFSAPMGSQNGTSPEMGNNEELRLPISLDLPVYRKIPGVKVELPISRNSWENHHSLENQNGGVEYLAPALASSLGLVNREQCTDLVDMAGSAASLYCEFGSSAFLDQSNLFYLRDDLLGKYLSETKQELVWIIWGERSFKTEYFPVAQAAIQEAMQGHVHIHKRLITLSELSARP